MIILLIVLVWYTVGVGGFIFWYTSEYDFLATDILLACIAGFTGPVAWLLGWSIHGKLGKQDKILIRKRTPRS